MSCCRLWFLFLSAEAAFVVAGPLGASRAADTPGGLANWFETVAEAERMAEQGMQRPLQPQPEPQADGRPVAVGARAINLDDLRTLIQRRHDHINRTKLFGPLAKLAKNQKLTKQEQQRLPGDLTEWFKRYFAMRAFLPSSRLDPALPAVTAEFEQAIKVREDFVEGRILAAACHLYSGDLQRAAERLEQASKFLSAHWLNVSPLGQDCCSSWLQIGRPEQVDGYVKSLKNKKAFPPKLMTSYQAWLVATHAWLNFRYNEAGDYFKQSLEKANVFGGKANAGVAGLIADAALFRLVASSNLARDPKHGAKLVALLPEGSESWPAVRARAALHAWQAEEASAAGDAEAAGRLWKQAVEGLEACSRECLPTLDAEIADQLQAYRDRKVWYRERPAPAAAGK